tara:strand:- start:156 stop:452 length:297 start_codon:yes stop_codon:yes gene_type:complete
MHEIFQTETFSKLCDASEKKEQIWIEKIKDQLMENLCVGKPLHYSWFREKKFENKRLYYLINETSKKAILIAFGNKKEQQKIINHILINKERYLRMID